MTTDSKPPDRILCKHCGYNLHGLREPRCPECGHDFCVDDPTTFDSQPIGAVRKFGRAWGRRIHICMITGLSLVALQTAIRIEVHNVFADGYLPRDPQEAAGRGVYPKWRGRWWDTPSRWLQLKGPKDSTGAPVNRPLSGVERDRMRIEVRQAQRMNELLGLVRTWGLLQYPCIVVLFAESVLLWVKSRWRVDAAVGVSGVGVAVLCAVLMVYREYYPSLGW